MIEMITKLRILDSNSNCIGYTLIDIQGNEISMHNDDIVSSIRNNKINVLDLNLLADNKLIETGGENIENYDDFINNNNNNKYASISRLNIAMINSHKSIKFKSNVDINAVKSKAILLGTEFTFINRHIYYHNSFIR